MSSSSLPPPRLIPRSEAEELAEASTIKRQAEAVGITRRDLHHPELGHISLIEAGPAVLLLHCAPTAAEEAAAQQQQREAERRRQHREELRRHEEAESRERPARG